MLHLNSNNGFDFITCYNRLIDGSPRSNIDCCNVVSVAREVTLNTSESEGITVPNVPLDILLLLIEKALYYLE